MDERPYETAKTREYRAWNGHLMENYVMSNGKLAGSWQAWHSSDCACENDGTFQEFEDM